MMATEGERNRTVMLGRILGWVEVVFCVGCIVGMALM